MPLTKRVGSSGAGVAINANSAASTMGTTVTASATPHTKGNYTEITSAAPFDVETIVLMSQSTTAYGGAGTDTGILLDIATGAAASEVVKVANLNFGWQNAMTGVTRHGIAVIYIPLLVPAGTRIAVRIQATQVSKAIRVALQLRRAGTNSAPPTVCTTYGADTATSRGVTLTTPGAINTEGAWTEITASTSAAARFIQPTMCLQDVTTISADSLVDIGIGGAGSEVSIIDDLPFASNNAELSMYFGAEVPFNYPVPAGSRLSARYQTSTAGATNPSVILHLYD